MSDHDILSDDTAPPKPYVPQQIDKDKDWLSELVGEDRKYKSPAELAYAAVHKDEHIRRLETETQMLRSELDKRANLEDVVDRLTSIQEARAKPDNRPPEPEPMIRQPAPEPAAKDISELVRSEFAAEQDKLRRASNAHAVKQELEKRFGANYENVVSSRVSKLGLGAKFANDLAQTQPEAFLALFETSQHDPSVAQMTAPQSALSPDRRPVSTGKRFKDYWAIYQKSPAEYMSTKVQNEIVAEAMRQGPSFYE